MLFYFHNNFFSFINNGQGVMNQRELFSFKFYVDYWTKNLYDFSFFHFISLPSLLLFL